MSNQERDIVDLKWLRDGEPDKHPEYVKMGRDELAGAHLLSDDELAYSLAMMSTISDERDTAMMIESHRTGGDYISKSLLGEIAKDRIRWLSRRVAVLEGRYPGVDAPKPVQKVPEPLQQAEGDAYARAVAEARLERQTPLLAGLLGLTNANFDIRTLPQLLESKGIKIEAIKIATALGYVLTNYPEKRWQIYVGVVRELLKVGIYIPFFDDVYAVKGNELVITKSKFLASGKRQYIRQLVEPQVQTMSLADLQPKEPEWGTIVPAEALEQIAKIEKRAEEIYNTWSDQEGWVPWQAHGNSDKQGIARTLAGEEILGGVDHGAQQ